MTKQNSTSGIHTDFGPSNIMSDLMGIFPDVVQPGNAFNDTVIADDSGIVQLETCIKTVTKHFSVLMMYAQSSSADWKTLYKILADILFVIVHVRQGTAFVAQTLGPETLASVESLRQIFLKTERGEKYAEFQKIFGSFFTQLNLTAADAAVFFKPTVRLLEQEMLHVLQDEKLVSTQYRDNATLRVYRNYKVTEAVYAFMKREGSYDAIAVTVHNIRQLAIKIERSYRLLKQCPFGSDIRAEESFITSLKGLMDRKIDKSL